MDDYVNEPQTQRSRGRRGIARGMKMAVVVVAVVAMWSVVGLVGEGRSGEAGASVERRQVLGDVGGEARYSAAVMWRGPEPPVPVEAGTIVEFEQYSRSAGVTTMRLGNGVVVHHRAMQADGVGGEAGGAAGKGLAAGVDVGGGDVRKRGRVVVSICIAGGEVEETASNRGLTAAAVSAWERLVVRSMRREDVKAFLDEGGTRVSSWVMFDSVMLRVEGDIEGVERGMRVARLLLTEPRVTAEDLEWWRGRMRSRREGGMGGGGAGGGSGRREVFQTVTDLMFDKGDMRPRRASEESTAAISVESAQAWINRMLGVGAGRASPTEASVVGDVTIEEAARLATLYLGTLPARGMMSVETFGAERRVPRSKDAMVATRMVEGVQDRAYIVRGFLGADLSAIREYRALAVAAEVIEGRIKQWPADERGEAGGGGRRGGGAGVQAIPGVAFPGYGLVLGVSEVPAHRAEELLEKMHGIFEAVRERGPSEDELAEVRVRLAQTAKETLGRIDYWSSILSGSVYHGLDLEEMAAAEAHYMATTATDVRRALEKYDTAERRVRVRLMPGGGRGE